MDKRPLVILMMSLCVLSGCATYDQIIKFDPNFYVARSRNGYIIDRHGNIINFNSQEIDKYACLHENKIIELRDILRNSRTTNSLDLSKEDLSKLDKALLLFEGTLKKLINRIDNEI